MAVFQIGCCHDHQVGRQKSAVGCAHLTKISLGKSGDLNLDGDEGLSSIRAISIDSHSCFPDDS